MAALLDRAGIDIILVGDSLASIVQGKATTLPVTMDQMTYHCACVAAGVNRALVVGDMPFLSYQISPHDAVRNAGRLVQEGGVGAVKLEGGAVVADAIQAIVRAEIPVMGHVGLTPQSVHRMGGYRVQGKGISGDKNLRSRVPAELGSEITEALTIPTIGIGAGNGCRGQILVTHDMLGLSTREIPKFVKPFGAVGDAVVQSVQAYISEVHSHQFPGQEHSYTKADSSRRLPYDVI
jgi:3-methyl-2-oxobutanoate hydroxymethyltransferase